MTMLIYGIAALGIFFSCSALADEYCFTSDLCIFKGISVQHTDVPSSSVHFWISHGESMSPVFINCDTHESDITSMDPESMPLSKLKNAVDPHILDICNKYAK